MVNLSVQSSRESWVIIMVALPEAGVGQEAEVGQGLPNNGSIQCMNLQLHSFFPANTEAKFYSGTITLYA